MGMSFKCFLWYIFEQFFKCFVFTCFPFCHIAFFPVRATCDQEIGLPEKMYILDTLRVEGTRLRDVLSQPMAESEALTLSTSVVSQADIEKQGAQTVIDALTYVPGAWIETRGRKVKQFFSIRGQTYPYPDYALDGAWQREFHELPFFFSAADIERIEVVRSSAALLKGVQGHVGIVNIVPRIYETRETSGEVACGTHQSYRARISHGATVDNVSYALSVQHTSTDGPEGRQAAERMTNLRTQVRWKPSQRLRIQAHAFYLAGRQELAQALPPADIRFQNALESYDPYRALLVGVKTHFQQTMRASSELQVYYTRRDPEFVNRGSGTHITARERDNEWGGHFTQGLALSARNTLRFGGLYNRWVVPDGKRFYTGRRVDVETISGVVVNEHQFDRVSVDAGLRWVKTHINEYGGFNIGGSAAGFQKVPPVVDTWEPAMFNATAGVTFRPTKRTSYHLHLASGTLQPRRGTLDVTMQEPKNERRLKLDVGGQRTFDGIGRVSAVGFLVHKKDAILLSGQTQMVNGLLMELYANRDQRQYGVELEARSGFVHRDVEVFFNVMAIQSMDAQIGGMVRNQEQPQVILSGGMMAEKSGWEMNVFGKCVSGYESVRFVAGGGGQPPRPQPLGDFVVFNASVGRQFDRGLRVFLDGQNLTNRAFSTVVGYPDYGRRWTVGMSQRLK